MQDIKLIKARLVGANLKRLLKSHRFTKWQVARDCNITYRTLLNWQSKNVEPSDELALRVAEYLGLIKKREKDNQNQKILELEKRIKAVEKHLRLKK